MGKYKWNLRDAREKKKELLQLFLHCENDDDRPNIYNSIMTYKEILKTASQGDRDIFSSLDDMNTLIGDRIEEIAYIYNKTFDKDDKNYKRYKHLPSIICTVMNSYIPLFEHWQFQPGILPKRIAADNDTLIEMARDFFKEKTDYYICQEFEKILTEDYNPLNISYDNNPKRDHGGFTMFDSINNRGYIYITRSNTVRDLYILPHEAFHFIFGDKQSGACYLGNGILIDEIDGWLSNILFEDYFLDNGPLQNNFFALDNRNQLFSLVENLLIRDSLLDSARQNKTVRLNKMNKFFDKFDCFFADENVLKMTLDMDFIPMLNYSYSMLAAIDLYYIYLEDPEKCFCLLKNIMNNIKCKNTMDMLRNNGITFMDDGYQNLIKYLKKEIS